MIEQVKAGEHVILTSCLQIKHHNFFGILIYDCEEKVKKRIRQSVLERAHNSLFFCTFLVRIIYLRSSNKI